MSPYGVIRPQWDKAGYQTDCLTDTKAFSFVPVRHVESIQVKNISDETKINFYHLGLWEPFSHMLMNFSTLLTIVILKSKQETYI